MTDSEFLDQLEIHYERSKDYEKIIMGHNQRMRLNIILGRYSEVAWFIETRIKSNLCIIINESIKERLLEARTRQERLKDANKK